MSDTPRDPFQGADDGLFRTLADASPAPLWCTDPAGTCVFLSRTWYELTGQDPNQGLGVGWLDAVHPADRDEAARVFIEANRERRAFSLDYRLRRASGEYRWAIDSGRPRFDEDGGFLGYVGSVVDIHERKQAEEALEDSEERFRNLVDHMSQLAWMADSKGWIFWYNRRWYDYTGTNLMAMEGWGWRKVHHPDHIDRVVERLQRSWDTGEPWEDTFPLRSRDGEYRWFLSRALPIRDEHGEIVRWFGTNTDVTEQRLAEERLRESDRRKDEYLAMLGHELRNPLAAIRSATDLIALTTAGTPSLERATAVLSRQSQHMSRLIDGLLEVSRIARGKIALSLEPLDLGRLVRQALGDRASLAADAGLELTVSIAQGPLWVRGDQVRLVQILDNVLGNAIKFTPAPGRIEVELSEVEGEVVLRVRDSGIGIHPSKLEEIFAPFHQEDTDVARSKGGLGLGLALSRGLSELHHGSISAHSGGLGLGAEFRLRLPRSERPEPQADPVSEPNQRCLQILIVEDNEDAAEMLGTLLERRGHAVAIASSGPKALELLAHQVFHVVLCDIGLPGMSGYELAQAITADPRLGRPHLVALTGYGQASDRTRTADAGFHHHLVKPVVLDELLAVLTGSREAA